MIKEMQEFIENKAVFQKLSGDTINNYTGWLNEFCKITKISTIDDFLSLVIDDLEKYVSELDKNNNQISSIWTKCIAVQSFYTYLIKKKVCNENLMSEVSLPRRDVKEFIPPTTDQVTDILTAVKKNKTYFLLIYFISQTGARISEATGIKLSDFVDSSVKLHGKGRKERTAYLNDNLMNLIEDYIANYRKPNTLLTESEYEAKHLGSKFSSYESYAKDINEAKDLLFLSKNGVRMKRNSVNTTLKSYAKKAGIDMSKTTVSNHKLRTNFATDGVVNQGISLPEMQLMLGHARIETTMRYMKMNTQQKKNSYGKVFDVGASFFSEK